MFKRRPKKATEAIILSVARSGRSVSQLKYVRGIVPAKDSRLKVYRIEKDMTSHMIFVSINNGQAVFQAEPMDDDQYDVGELMSLEDTERIPLNTA